MEWSVGIRRDEPLAVWVGDAAFLWAWRWAQEQIGPGGRSGRVAAGRAGANTEAQEKGQVWGLCKLALLLHPSWGRGHTASWSVLSAFTATARTVGRLSARAGTQEAGRQAGLRVCPGPSCHTPWGDSPPSPHVGSASSLNTTLPSTSAWSSVRASNYSVPLSTAQSTSGGPQRRPESLLHECTTDFWHPLGARVAVPRGSFTVPEYREGSEGRVTAGHSRVAVL